MDEDSYFWKTKKRPLKTKPRTKQFAKEEKYFEAEKSLFQELEENNIGYRRKFQFESARNCWQLMVSGAWWQKDSNCIV